MKPITSLFLVLCLLQLSGQHQRSISGVVYDQQTKQPLAFATIGIPASPHGTVSNADGEFTFFVPDYLKDDTISISYVGFKRTSIPIQLLDDSPIHVYLQESIIELEEIEVSGEQLTAKQIMEKALDRIKDNFQSDPFILKGFFRDIRDQNNKTVYLSEAAVDIRDPGVSVNKQLPKKFYLRGVRASDSRVNSLLRGSLLNSGNSLTVNLEHNYWLNRLRHSLATNEYTIDQILSDADKQLYVVKTEQFSSKPDLAEKYKDMKYRLIHKYYVNAETFAILKVEHLEEPIEGKYVGIERPYIGDSLYYSKKGWNQLIEFEEYEGKLYLKYHDVSYAFDIVDEKNSQIHLDMAYQFTFIVTEVISNKTIKPEGQKMNRNKPLTTQLEYEEDFWADPINVKLVPLTEKQIQDLESEKTLSRQFRTKKQRIKKS